MSPSNEKSSIAIITACANANGSPDFALTVVKATTEEIANGCHYDLAAAELLENGYDPPFVHFDALEGPAFLHPAVRHVLGLPPTSSESANVTLVENY